MHFAFALFAFWPYITTILINFSHLQAMSSDSDDFDFAAPVGLPAVLGGGLGSESGGGVFDFAPAVAAPRAVSDSDADFDFAVSAPVAQKRRRQRTLAPTLGAFWTVAITKDSETAAPGTHSVHGLVEMQWELLREGVSREAVVGGGVCGAVVYSLRRFVALDNVATLPAGFNVSGPLASLHVLAAIGDATVADDGSTVSRFLMAQGVRVEKEALICSSAEAAILRTAAPGPQRFRHVPIYRRWADPARRICSLPKQSVFKRWRKANRYEIQSDSDGDAQQQPAATAQIADHLTYIPHSRVLQTERPRQETPVGGPATDPVRLVHALSVLQHLRSPKLFVVALDDAYDYLFQDDDGREARNSEKDPRRSSLQKALARADVVSLNITRRMFKQWRQEGVVKAINVFSDASPVVGTELQGMLVDVVLTNGEVHRIILPGSTLAYGHTGTMGKGAALLWAIWLIAGPTADDVQWFCYNVRSFTTDFGVEMHLLDLPDFIEAMVAWAGGRPLDRVGPLIKPDSRMFRRALRLAGWSHTMGGVMKGTAEGMPQWPTSLTHMRVVCKTYKNATYRRHIRRKLDLSPEEDRSMISFTAGFAKWRYETVFEVLRQLNGVRAVSAKVQPVLFPRAQDREEMGSFFVACRDAAFWRWASASFRHIFRELEYLRRWGMVCDCPEHRAERKRTDGKKFIKCPRTHYSTTYLYQTSLNFVCRFRPHFPCQRISIHVRSSNGVEIHV